ncbi:type I glutamate--ammonia ligase [Desulfuribacillus alkaliarsenatis]|uniref:Glutamine synthetase n=1 Tax=Desulfuribacillus alkaliarsenatis TaxID=766136 RepID=A0A1E5G0A8_9FIRM|nr:type I glutamate--ammonia ligase [Desulfuribacillus alkaliarsenatis]OEF96275.1 type I glutamate--ammonia ligase [Desulfuribacillus alkaliarsenatis]
MELAKAEIIRIATEFNIKFIRLQFVDIVGRVKNIAIPVKQLKKALNGEVIFDATSIDGFNDIDNSEYYLIPDINTFVVLPWRTAKARVARLICDIYTLEKKPFDGCSRYTLKKVLREAEQLGYMMNAGVELEFFLFLTNQKDCPTINTNDRAGYFDMSTSDVGDDARREMVLALEQIGFEVESSHHEVAEGQHEIRFRYSDALDMADKIVTFRTVVKSIAKNYGLHATFMPKPISGIDGSGMHTHQSLFKNNNSNAFWDARAPMELSDDALYYIGGLLKHAKAITAITNSTVNSYKRLVPGYDAPIYIAWSSKNRGAFIRVPEKKELSTRIELRSPDAACNPYLALAVMLRAGLEGIKKKLTPPEPINTNVYSFTDEEKKAKGIEMLPLSIGEALGHLESDEIIKNAIGFYISEQFISLKKREWSDYLATVHHWERDYYISKY